MKKVINQKFEVITRIMLALTIIFTSFGYTTLVFADTVNKGDIRNEVNSIGSTTNAGDVELKKTVEKTNDEGIYKVTLTAKGKDTVTSHSQTGDIYTVVVLDTSGSMKDVVCVDRPILLCRKWEDIKYPKAVEGTKTFANTLLGKYPNAQIALVTFSTAVTEKRGFSNTGFDSVSFPDPNGLTNLGAAIQKADEMLASKKKTNPNAKLYMVILSDGYPEEETVDHTTAANHAKNTTGIEIFTIGYDTTEDTQKLLEGVATNSKHYSNANGSDVAQKFNNIAGSIEIHTLAGTNATITDTIADGFTYVEGSAEGTTPTVNGQNISFYINEVTEEGKTVSFKIKIDKDLATGWHPTNDGAKIDYTKSDDSTDSKIITDSAEVYWEQETYKYTVKYYKDSIDGTLLGTAEDKAVKNAKIYASDININAYKPTGYNDGVIDTSMPYTITGENDVIKVVYTKKTNLSYTVEYYKDGEKISKDNENTVNNQTYGDKVLESNINKNKYKPLVGYTDGTIETDMPYEIKDGNNVIRVCYERRTDMSYTVKYLDKDTNEELYTSVSRKDRTFGETYVETAKEAPYGYTLVSNTTQNVIVDEENKVVTFYYQKRNDFNYKVNYLDKDTNKPLADQKQVSKKTFNKEYTETAINITGYNVVGDKTNVFTLKENGQEITFFYTKKTDLSYKVVYYKDSLSTESIGEEVIKNQTFNSTIEANDINVDLYKPGKGYNSGVIATTMPYTIIDGENVISVIYSKKDNLTYRVEYYYDNNIDSSKTDYFEGFTYGEIITNYTEKLPADYKFVSDTAPLTIDDSEDNVIKVYYESVAKGDIEPPKTGINSTDYLSITCIIGMIAVVLTSSKKKQEN